MRHTWDRVLGGRPNIGRGWSKARPGQNSRFLEVIDTGKHGIGGVAGPKPPRRETKASEGGINDEANEKYASSQNERSGARVGERGGGESFK